MATHNFDQIAQALLKQKQLMDNLQAENRELREQIADLRSVRGIFIEIDGIRFALRDDSPPVQTTSASSVPASPSPSASTIETSTLSAPPHTQQIVEAPTEAIPEITSQLPELSIKEGVSPSNNDKGNKPTSGESTFLEEIMLDEFNNALTSPSAVWQDPTEKKTAKEQPKPQEPINEKQKEALRRELMGSYLLE